METGQSRLWMLTGQRGVGKTTFCHALTSHALLEGWQVSGIITPVIFAGNEKVGILAESLETGEARPLASLDRTALFDLPVGKWYFDRSVIAWGNQVIRDSIPCDLLIIDEFGPMELIRHKGWWDSVDIFDRDEYRAALVVVRPELQEVARQTFNIAGTIIVGDGRQTDQLVRDFWSKISTT